LIVDNASSTPVAKTWDLSWHPNGRHVREEEPGLTVARLRGIRESTAELLVFVDDDNILDARYLETACHLATEWPKIGVFGGSQIAAYELPPDDDIKDHLHMLAIRTVSQVLWTNIKGIDHATPRGAGLCIRRHLAISYGALVESDPLRKMLGRSGKSGLLSGEDTDLAWCVCDLGFGMLVTPSLTLTHCIDQRRLDKSYLIKIAEGHAASGVILSHLHSLPKSNSVLIDNFRDFLRILQARGFFGKQLTIYALKGRHRGRKILEDFQSKGRTGTA
jgi:GT2 family glycosyltransferase